MKIRKMREVKSRLVLWNNKENITERINIDLSNDTVEKTIMLQIKKMMEIMTILSKKVLEDYANIQHLLFSKVKFIWLIICK
jgi:hypothetical protein